jgi:hypothetical protein
MKDQYHTSRRSGLGNLLQILGVLFAFTLLIGALDKAGVKVIFGSDNQDQHSSMMPAYAQPSTNEEGQIIVVDAQESNDHYAEYKNNKYHASATRTAKLSSHGEEWIEQFASSARKQALEKGVPAGLALAVGLHKISKGTTISSWNDFIKEITIPLVAVKQTASKEDLRAYFKYSANSGRWIDGLEAIDYFDQGALNAYMSKYKLKQYDKEVMGIIANGGSYIQEAEKRSTYVAGEVATEMVSKRVAKQTSEKSKLNSSSGNENVENWEQYYDEVVGKAVAKEIARRKLKSGQYLSEDDMQNLIEETNDETSDVVKNNISFLGRKINPDHPEAKQMQDITNPRNAQAREELYQKKLRENKMAGRGN